MKASEFNKPVKPTGQLAELTEPQREQLSEWLNTTKTYEEIMDLVKEDFGITLTSTNPLKQFRKRMYAALLQARPVCPPGVPRDVWEDSLGKLVNVLLDPDTPIERRVRVSAFLLQLARLTIDNNRLNTKSSKVSKTAAHAKKSRKDSSDGFDEPNPLDDDAKLEEVRHLFIGPDPDEESSPNASAAQQPPAGDSPVT